MKAQLLTLPLVTGALYFGAPLFGLNLPYLHWALLLVLAALLTNWLGLNGNNDVEITLVTTKGDD